MTKPNPNAKDPSWQVPVNLPGVDPEDYDAGIDSARGSANQSSAKGFDRHLGGHAIADRNDTTSFDVQPALQKKLDQHRAVDSGLEEGGRKRQPNTGFPGRSDAQKFTASTPEPGVDALVNPLKKTSE